MQLGRALPALRGGAHAPLRAPASPRPLARLLRPAARLRGGGRRRPLPRQQRQVRRRARQRGRKAHLEFQSPRAASGIGLGRRPLRKDTMLFFSSYLRLLDLIVMLLCFWFTETD